MLALCLLASWVSAIAAAPNVTLDECRYPTDAAANAAWRPMAGTIAAGASTVEGQPALRLRCNFAGGQLERASWDRAVKLDLASCRGVQFKLLCRDASPVSYFSLYFQSGAGWYHATFFPETGTGWNTITIDRSEMKPEGKPAGWDQIRTIRISAWRARDVDTEFYVSDLRRTGVLGADAVVAVVSGASTVAPAAARGRTRESAAELLADQFQALGVPCALLEDSRLTAEQLKPAQLAALPPGQSLSDGALQALARYLDQGGKVLSLSTLPPRLKVGAGQSNSVALKRADWPREPDRQSELLLTSAGALAPEVLCQAAQASLKRIGHIASFNSFEEATNRITELLQANPTASAAAKSLASALAARAAAEGSAGRQQFTQALAKAQESNRFLETAFCAAQRPEPGEFRAFWCHSAFGVLGLDWDKAIKRLADNGFTAILPNMLWGGAAFYDSKVLPVAAQVAERGDQIRQCVAACRKYGLQIHVWKVDWNLGTAAPKSFVDQMRQAGRLQASVSGKEEPWLCPSHPENQKLEVDAMLEVVRNYDVDGIHFDYIRYPDGDHCFCAGCKERFQRACGNQLQNWPADVLAGGPLRQQWLDWRRSNINTVVKTVSEQARALKPRIKISAAVFRQWNTDRDGVGQDWKLWCDRGWVDFVCPMDYTPSTRRFENMVSEQVAWAGRVPCYPGLGVSASSSRFGPDRAVEEINITRQHHTHGFVIFNYGAKESEDLLPMLGMGVTGPERRSP